MNNVKRNTETRKKETIVNDAAITFGETIGHVALAIWSLLYLFIVGPIMFVVNLVRGEEKNNSAVVKGLRNVIPKKKKASNIKAAQRVLLRFPGMLVQVPGTQEYNDLTHNAQKGLMDQKAMNTLLNGATRSAAETVSNEVRNAAIKLGLWFVFVTGVSIYIHWQNP